jgi:uncharacterized protein (TIGR02466 family)
MSSVDLFPTTLYYAPLQPKLSQRQKLIKELRSEIPRIREYDIEGERWSQKNYMGGYTSYGSLSELHQFSSTFAELKSLLDKHVKRFATQLDADLENYSLEMTQMWINVMPQKVVHTGHIHPLSSISGTFYVDVPKGVSQIKFEDPRLACFMGSIPRKSTTNARSRRHYEIKPKEGHLVLFESWLRHEVPANPSPKQRTSVSFNYNWF